MGGSYLITGTKQHVVVLMFGQALSHQNLMPAFTPKAVLIRPSLTASTIEFALEDSQN